MIRNLTPAERRHSSRTDRVRRFTQAALALWSAIWAVLAGRDAVLWFLAGDAAPRLLPILSYWFAVWLFVVAFLIAPLLWCRLAGAAPTARGGG
ncbi:MAG TPA: hypothetical protein VF234_08760 [Limnochordia bacterium]